MSPAVIFYVALVWTGLAVIVALLLGAAIRHNRSKED